MDPRTFCETLYCAFTAVDAFAMAPNGRMTLGAHTVEHGNSSLHQVEFIGVRGLRRERDRGVREAQPGDALELSVIELERESEGWRVWFNPWYVEEIEFHCDRIILDGVEVKGTGRWLQDDLPKRPAW